MNTPTEASRRCRPEVEYRVEVDRGCEWRWGETFRTLKAARYERTRLREEGEEREMRIVRVTMEVLS